MRLKSVLRLILIALIVVAVFDPANQVTNLKIPLFVAAWLFFFLAAFIGRNVRVHRPALLVAVAFGMLLPLYSVCYYAVTNGDFAHFDGFQYLQSYAFFLLVIILTSTDIDLLRPLCITLTWLSGVIVLIAILAMTSSPETYLLLYELGAEFGVLALSERTYGGATFLTIYYVTAPLLVVSVGYFSRLAVESRGYEQVRNVLLLALNVLGMFLAGTRNSIIFSIVVPLLVLVWYSKRKSLVSVGTVLVLISLATLNSEVILDMLDPGDVSNAPKLLHLRDYLDMLSDPIRLVLGYGLGSFFYSRGFGEYTSLTELTYFEFIRSFGLVLAMAYYMFLLFPLIALSLSRAKKEHALYLSYACYLLMSATNPFLVSSSGMLVISIVWYTTFKILRSPTKFALQHGVSWQR
jgi:hypothetical protein